VLIQGAARVAAKPFSIKNKGDNSAQGFSQKRYEGAHPETEQNDICRCDEKCGEHGNDRGDDIEPDADQRGVNAVLLQKKTMD
jgi:hypothetical protein